MLIDVDFALARIGVQHREMELADAYYMISKYNELKKGNEMSQEIEDGGNWRGVGLHKNTV